MTYGNLKYVEIEAYKAKDNISEIIKLFHDKNYVKENNDSLQKLSQYRILKNIKIITDNFILEVKASKGNLHYDISSTFKKYFLFTDFAKRDIYLKDIVLIWDEYTNKHNELGYNKAFNPLYMYNNLFKFGVLENNDLAKYTPFNYLEYKLRDNDDNSFSKCICLLVNFWDNSSQGIVSQNKFNLIGVYPSKDYISFNEKASKGACILYKLTENM